MRDGQHVHQTGERWDLALHDGPGNIAPRPLWPSAGVILFEAAKVVDIAPTAQQDPYGRRCGV